MNYLMGLLKSSDPELWVTEPCSVNKKFTAKITNGADMEPHNKKGLIWIVAFFLILNGGLALFAFM